MERINQYDRVLLSDGREGSVVEVLGDQDQFVIDVGPTYDIVKRVDIVRIIAHAAK